MARRIEAVLFDLDNTLADRVGAFKRLCKMFWSEEPAINSKADFDSVYQVLLEKDQDGATAPKSNVFLAAQEKWGKLTRSEFEIETWYEENYPSCFEPDPRVLGFLGELNYKGIPWGIVTNGQPFQANVIEATGLGSGNSGVVISSVFGQSKPHPSIFEEGMRVIGHTSGPTSCLFVGDNPVADIGGAHGVGMVTGWVSRGRGWQEQEYGPDFVVNHIDELRSVIGV